MIFSDCLKLDLENESEPAFRHSFEGVSESSSNRRLDQHRSRPTALSSTITWLAQEATLRSNYQHFVNSQHRVLQNSEIILVWKFASDFYDIYHRAKSNVVCSFHIYLFDSSCSVTSVLGNSHNKSCNPIQPQYWRDLAQ